MGLPELGQYLKQRRLELGISMKDAATAAGITPAYLWMLETAHNPKTNKPSRPSRDKLERLARVLICDPALLLSFAGYVSLDPVASSAPEVPDPRPPESPPFDEAVLQLPVPFVGRADDSHWLLGCLRGERSARIIALNGLGGIGKTALVAAVLRTVRQERRFRDGIAVVSCTQKTDASDVLRAVLRRFDPRREPPDDTTDVATLMEITHQRLAGRDALVVLDNVEPDLPIAVVIQALRETGVAVLLTSRHILPRSAVPQGANRVLDVLTANDALDLFAHALGHSSPDALSEADRAASERIVASLGNHTLAIKLAGAYAADAKRDLLQLADDLADPRRAVMLPTYETPDEIRRRFMWSVESLPEGAQALFASFAVCAPLAISRQAMLVVASAIGIPTPEAHLNLLVLRALLDASLDAEMPARGERERVEMHPLLYGLALLQLDTWDLERQRAARWALASYYLHHADDAARIAGEPHIETVLQWAHEHHEHALVSTICLAMATFWRDHSRTTARLRYLPWAIDAVRSAHLTTAAGPHAKSQQAHDDSERERDQQLFFLLLEHGHALQTSGDIRAAEGCYQKCQPLARSPGEHGAVNVQLGRLAQRRGHLDEAEQRFRDAQRYLSQAGDRRAQGVVHRLLGQVAELRGDLDEAEHLLARAETIAREFHDRFETGEVLAHLGRIDWDRGRLDAAEKHLREALRIARDIKARGCESVILRHLGRVKRDQGELSAAEGYFKDSRTIAEEVRDRRGIGTILAQLGRLHERQGNLDQAEQYLQQALYIARTVQDCSGEALNLGELGLIKLRRDEVDAAERLFQDALTIAREIHDRPNEGKQLSRLGQVAIVRGQLDAAETTLRDALRIHQDVRNRRGEGIDLMHLGEVAQLHGNLDAAEDFFQQALRIATAETCDPREQSAALTQLGSVALARRQTEQAHDYLTQALDRATKVNDRRQEATILMYLGALANIRGELSQAATYFEESLELRRMAHDRRGEAAVLGKLGALAARRGDVARAERYRSESLEIERALRARAREGSDLSVLAQVAYESGRAIELTARGEDALAREQLADAEEHFQAALGVWRAIQDRRGEGEAVHGLARVATARGLLDQAETYLERGRAIRRERQRASDLPAS